MGFTSKLISSVKKSTTKTKQAQKKVYRQAPSAQKKVHKKVTKLTKKKGSGANKVTKKAVKKPLYRQAPSMKLASQAKTKSFSQKIKNGIGKVTFSLVSVDEINELHNMTGLSPNRAEIISMVDFKPIFDSVGAETTVYEMLKYKLTFRQLLKENVDYILKNADVDTEIASAANSKLALLNEINEDIATLEALAVTFSTLQTTLDIKDNSSEIISLISRPGVEEESLRDFFVNKLAFSNESYTAFSNTKVLCQILSDLKSTCNLHSPSLFSTNNNSRIDDVSPFAINNAVVQKNQSHSFDLSNLAAANFNPKKPGDYNKFQSSIENLSKANKVKLLVSALTRELTVSLGVAVLDDTTLGKKYSVAGKNRFNTALGAKKATIFDLDKDSLASIDKLLMLDIVSKHVFPFETRTIDASGKKYISGKTALVDNAIKDNTTIDYNNFKAFSNQFGTEVTDIEKYITTLTMLDAKQDDRVTHAGLFKSLCTNLKQSLSVFTRVAGTNIEAALIASLFASAATDNELRYLLFKYICKLNEKTSLKSSKPQQTNLLFDADEESEDSQADDEGTTSIDGFSVEPTQYTVIDKSVGANAKPTVSDDLATLASQISKRVSKLLVSTSDRSDLHTIRAKNTAVYTTLANMSGDGSTNDNSFFDILSILSEVKDRVSSGYTVNYLNTQGLTKFNELSEETLLLLICELYTTFLSLNTNAVLLRSDKELIINYDIAAEIISVKKLNLLNDSTQVSATTPSPLAMMKSLRAEDDTAIYMLELLSATAKALNNSVVFANTAMSNTDANKLLSKLAKSDSQDVLLSTTTMQNNIRTLYASLSVGDQNYFPHFDVAQHDINALISMLSNPALAGVDGSNVKTVAVGAPMGYSNYLDNAAFNNMSENFEQSDAQKDILNVSVHKLDYEFSDIVFDSIDFLFDETCFITPLSFENIAEPVRFNQLLDSNITVFYVSNGVITREKVTNDMLTSRYENMSLAQSRQLIMNHVTSYLFDVYHRIMSSYSQRDFDLFANVKYEKELIDARGVEILRKVVDGDNRFFGSMSIRDFVAPESIGDGREWFRLLKYHEVSQTLQRENVTDDAFYTLSALYRTTHVSQAFIWHKTMHARAFDRIFVLPVDNDEFVVDVDKTALTRNGKRSLESDSVRSQMIEHNGIIKLKPKKIVNGNASLATMFATINKVTN
jgi:hypothetical protein